MDKKIKRRVEIQISVYLYGLAFLFYKISRYPPSFSFTIAIAWLTAYCLISYILLKLLGYISGTRWRGVMVILLWASVLHVAGIARLSGHDEAYTPGIFYIIFYLSVPVFLFLVHYFLRSLSPITASFVNRTAALFLGIFSLICITNALLQRVWQKDEQALHVPPIASPGNHIEKSTIVWVLLDEYGSSASLQAEFGFHNPMDRFLSTNHFIVLPHIRSRFNNTLFSVNSIFNNEDSIPPSSYFSGIDLLKRSVWVKALERNGYEFINLSFFDIGQHPMIADRSGYPQNFSAQLLSGTLFSVFLQRNKYTVASCDEYNQRVLSKLDSVMQVEPPAPRFVWAHLMIPHQPFCRNSQGLRRRENEAETTDSAAIKRNYIDYVQYANTVVARILQNHSLLQKSIVIISGDHGPRYPFLSDKAYQYQPFAAIRFPGHPDTCRLQETSYLSQLPWLINAQIFRKKGATP